MTELDKAAQEHHVKYWFSEPSPSASFISGAEWMQERMFAFAEWCDDMGYTQVENSLWKSFNDEKSKTTKQLFEQFEKQNTFNA